MINFNLTYILGQGEKNSALYRDDVSVEELSEVSAFIVQYLSGCGFKRGAICYEDDPRQVHSKKL